MSDYVIKVENLSKSYTLLHQQTERYTALRDVIAHNVQNIGKRLVGNYTNGTTPTREEFWAIENVSFEIKQGERVGIIGRNGAGKSTLLKILSRIVEPTKGRVHIRGRVASLLEVGTGFHPELTGRENIYLNGAILGMTRTEIKRKFDEIVAFAEVERFLDTPVKRYSSGMYVRLAFAVAANLEPEILIVDEVLAVGDAQFQKKCLGKMGDVAKEGRTVLFVSHNMAAIGQLCESCILLDQGRLKTFDQTEKVLQKYLATNDEEQDFIHLTDDKVRQGSQEVKFDWIRLQNFTQMPCRQFSIGEDITIVFCIKPNQSYQDQKIKVAVEIRTLDGIQLCNIVDTDSRFQLGTLAQSETISVCIKDIRLYPDTYYLSFWVGSTTSTEIFDYVKDCLSFEIVDGGKLTTRLLPRSAGLLFLTPEWYLLSKEIV